MISMKYIDKVSDLSIKTAQINCTPIIRRLRAEARLPLDKEFLLNEFVVYFVTPTDISIMENSLNRIPIAIEKIDKLHKRRDELHVEMSLTRTMRELDSMYLPLKNNIEFAKDILESQEKLLDAALEVFNAIKHAKTNEEKRACDEILNVIFENILRNKDFRFNSDGILSEAEFARINNLSSAMYNGFFYHTKMAEATNKLDFNTIKHRIPTEKLRETDEIGSLITEVRKGIECAANTNLNMAKLAVIIFAYIAWLTE